MLNVVSDASDLNKISQYLSTDGYVIVKEVYTFDECERVKSIIKNEKRRAQLLDHSDKFILPNAAHLLPELSDVITSQKLLNVMQSVFDNQKFCFTSHSDIHINTVAAWHKDDGKGKYFEGKTDYFSSNSCKVYKIGMYLQDCVNSGGLTVKAGSHRTGYSKLGLDYNSDDPEIYLPSTVGDIVIFDVRITHKGDSDLSTNLVQRFLKKLGLLHDKVLDYQRFAMFFTFGLENEYTRIFSDKNMERQIHELKDDSSKTLPKALKHKLDAFQVGTYF